MDDDEVYLYITKKTLSNLSEDMFVKSFTDGEQAIEYIHDCLRESSNLPDLILLDINMPFMDGWGFLAEFKKMKSALPSQNVHILMVTSSNVSSDLKRAQEFEELTGYVVKPVYEDKLVEILTDVFDGDFNTKLGYD